ncbi:CubicO group peptidase, beta-lactamase class C family [Streptosporangium subroseum]|uniref:CubicO group peptidase, beta-lactamase class C family n=1 Tax=Streptosporangium subroseum TaxID=106412 RepID=A0A239PD21_9ACTN|nr:serine hydrolase domain-containing protein [Streptosporangium subroseum]SNT64937.1 CubicO group peptidase, beta-lactamase class C family [Streptosporangium subroseum]
MGDAMDLASWQDRFDGLARRHGVPGASLAVLADERVQALATGVLHVGTGVEATTDSLFQIGSITKAYTATVVMGLVEGGLTTLDTPVADILPGFRVADADVSERVTLRHLLAHTSGINGDLFIDTGRGDDCLERYVDACADLPQCHPLGALFSYCTAGYVILGRVIELLTGTSWDTAIRERLLDPAKLDHTWTLPEDVLRFRAAMGHLTQDGQAQPAPVWSFPRNGGPDGGICATATDVVTFAKLHLNSEAPRFTDMRKPQVDVPNPHGTYDRWGLGWALFDWDRPVFGHDGDTIGQAAALRVVPDAGVAVALLANTDVFGAFSREVLSELLPVLCDLRMPASPAPPPVPAPVELKRYLGVYERVGTRVEVELRDGRLRTLVTPTGALAALMPPQESELVAVADGRFLQKQPESDRWVSTVFLSSPDGAEYLYRGIRAHPKVG